MAEGRAIAPRGIVCWKPAIGHFFEIERCAATIRQRVSSVVITEVYARERLTTCNWTRHKRRCCDEGSGGQRGGGEDTGNFLHGHSFVSFVKWSNRLSSSRGVSIVKITMRGVGQTRLFDLLILSPTCGVRKSSCDIRAGLGRGSAGLCPCRVGLVEKVAQGGVVEFDRGVVVVEVALLAGVEDRIVGCGRE